MTHPKFVSQWDKDPSEWTEADLVNLREQAAKRHATYERIARENLREGVHFGVYAEEGDTEALVAPERPYLYPGGAALLRELLRHTARNLRDPIWMFSGEVVGVTCEVGHFSHGGRLMGVAVGHANTREPWWRRGPKDWRYDDPREAAQGCLTQAFKRAARNATLEGFALVSLYASAEEHQRMYAQAPIPKGLKRWDPKEKDEAKSLMRSLGMKNDELVRLVCRLFGRPMVQAGDEAQYLIDYLTRELERKTRPAREELAAEMAA